MPLTDSQVRYSAVARWLHWIIAILIITNLVLGIGHDALEGVLPKTMPIHKSIGLTVLVLTLLRIVWRLTHRAPPLPRSMPAWEKGVAHLTHFTFYALMLLLPLSGWIMSSAGKYPLNYFGLFDVPKFAVTKADPIVGIAHTGHEVLGFAWIALIILHILAALRHQFLLRDNLMRRMI